jgi:ribosomal protein S3AE
MQPNTTVDESTLDLDALKKKHKVVKKLTVVAKDGSKHEFVVVRPTLQHFDMITKNIQDSKPHKVREILRNSCVIAGDKNVLDTDDDVRSNVFERISEMYEKLEVEEKEL